APAHDAMKAAGARWGCSWGLEIPLLFAPKDFEETPTLKRSNAFPIVAEECRAVRDGVGLLDIAGFSRFEVTGEHAGAYLDRLTAGRLPRAGRARLAPMLGPDGRLKGDLTIFNWGDGSWWIMGSYYLRQWHMRWFQGHNDGSVDIRDISDATVGFSLSGPKSRDVLASLTHQDVSHEALPFMGCMSLDVGLIRARVGRLSVAGELGYEINCSAAEHITLREMILEAGAEHGLREYGYYALDSLRLEKSFGVWSKEFTQGYTPGMTGMDRWIAFDKGDFVGREAALAESEGAKKPQRLVTLEVDAEDADASGYEPVWKDGKRIGFITSGGYGHVVQKSLAMALVEPQHAQPGAELTAHIVGVERAVRVIEPSPHDPGGVRMRQ
ncbi:MAG: aminomethyltransferase family protein, partial [Alphaproteobacteria bacterium]|nr:aminomethyltransferase family protein [Alphaproteobacteria bacterium]